MAKKPTKKTKAGKSDPIATVRVDEGFTFVLYELQTFVIEGTGLADADEVILTLDNPLVEWSPSVITREDITKIEEDDYSFTTRAVLKVSIGTGFATHKKTLGTGDGGLTITINGTPTPPPPAHSALTAVTLSIANPRFVFGVI